MMLIPELAAGIVLALVVLAWSREFIVAAGAGLAVVGVIALGVGLASATWSDLEVLAIVAAIVGAGLWLYWLQLRNDDAGSDEDAPVVVRVIPDAALESGTVWQWPLNRSPRARHETHILI